MDRHNIMVYLSVEADTAEQAKQKVQDILQMVSRADVQPTSVLIDTRYAIQQAIVAALPTSPEDEKIVDDLIADRVSARIARRASEACTSKRLKYIGTSVSMEEALEELGDPATWEADKIALEKKNATRRLPVCQQCGFYHPGGSCWDS